MKTETIIIRDRHFELPCASCAQAMSLGDTVVLLDGTQLACSERCAEELHAAAQARLGWHERRRGERRRTP